MEQEFAHEFDFDPRYGETLQSLLGVEGPAEPEGFVAFWQQRYARAREHTPTPELRDTGVVMADRRIFDLTHRSTDGVQVGGWLTVPLHGEVRRGFVVGHGYGGREAPDLLLPFDDAAIAFPCARGLGRSPHASISADPRWHVLHDIDDVDRYVHGGCVEDLWLAVSALEHLFPAVVGRIGYLGSSFGGGIGVMASAWDPRITRAHVHVPSFGDHPRRMVLPTTGSAASVQAFAHRYPGVADRALAFHDAAVAARHVAIPTHCACALFDPVVAPPGQFAIYNALPGAKDLFVLRAGHYGHPEQAAEEDRLRAALVTFFAPLSDLLHGPSGPERS